MINLHKVVENNTDFSPQRIVCKITVQYQKQDAMIAMVKTESLQLNKIFHISLWVHLLLPLLSLPLETLICWIGGMFLIRNTVVSVLVYPKYLVNSLVKISDQYCIPWGGGDN